MSDTPHDRRVTIITWHYVRNDASADLHARSVTEFDHQLEHIAANFTPVTLDAVIAATQDGNTALPANACLLTFDDGYRDHFETVFPRLAERGWQGVFFPVARAARDHKVLDVNKIQFAIAAAGLETISNETRTAIDDARTRPRPARFPNPLYASWLSPDCTIRPRPCSSNAPCRHACRPNAARPDLRAICSPAMCHRTSRTSPNSSTPVSTSCGTCLPAAWRSEGHGERHNRMNELEPGLRATVSSRGPGSSWSPSASPPEMAGAFCYPYGAFDDAAISAARQAGCTTAFTLEPRIADLSATRRWPCRGSTPTTSGDPMTGPTSTPIIGAGTRTTSSTVSPGRVRRISSTAKPVCSNRSHHASERHRYRLCQRTFCGIARHFGRHAALYRSRSQRCQRGRARALYPSHDFHCVNALTFEPENTADLVNATGVMQHEPRFDALLEPHDLLVPPPCPVRRQTGFHAQPPRGYRPRLYRQRPADVFCGSVGPTVPAGDIGTPRHFSGRIFWLRNTPERQRRPAHENGSNLFPPVSCSRSEPRPPVGPRSSPASLLSSSNNSE